MPALTRASLAFASVVAAMLVLPRGATADDAVERCASAAEKGQAMRRAGRLIEARTELRRCADQACPLIIRGDCARWADETQRATPSVVVRSSVGERDVSDVRLYVDNVVAAERLDGRPLSVDPGEHVLRAQARSGEWTASTKLLLASGEHDRVITLKFVDPDGAPTVTRRKPSTLSWILGGLAAGASVGSGVAYGLGVSERSRLVDTCAGPRVCSAQSIDQARTKLVVGDVLIGVGVVSLASAVVLYLVAPRIETRVIKTALLPPTIP